ncbi:TetR/AcrR family transcriptional regulator [Myceligenerans indicum]|nr:TetR/AcrR family transcriptional regulator [Myceligenerans indicum]
MVTTQDRRVRRTRRALLDALLALMAEKGYEEVTIQDIIDRADVGRSTFYNHYSNKEDLLKDGFADLRLLIDPSGGDASGRPPDPLRFSLPLLRHLDEQRQVAMTVFGAGRLHPVLAVIEGLLADIVRGELPAFTAGGIPREAVVGHIIGSHLALVQWWLMTSPDSTPEEVDAIFRALTRPPGAADRMPPGPPG